VTDDDPGRVVLVATPIGNLGDLSPRAAETLRTADIVYCEDTRRTRGLLTHAGITGIDTRSLHARNEADRVPEALAAVGAGATVAVVTDAGMPAVSDPGARLVAAAAAAGHEVTVVPGPSAPLAALVVSGLPTGRFAVEGFLPRTGTARRARLSAVAADDRTTVVLESPQRLAATLDDLAAVCGPARPAAVARELTKVHEEVWRGPLAELAGRAAGGVRGEIVIVVAAGPPAAPAEVDDDRILAALAVRRAAGERTRGAVDAVAADLKVARRRVYALAVGKGGNEPPTDGVAPREAGPGRSRDPDLHGDEGGGGR
jgi:16S rRNA (cytidine1402-2'-O)-methyltransferase